MNLGEPGILYAVKTLLRMVRRGHSLLALPKLTTLPGKSTSAAEQYSFLAKFLGYLALSKVFERVNSQDLEAIYRRLFPHSKIVGDKYPDYVFHLDTLSTEPLLRCLALVREPKDVVASVLDKVRSEVWRGDWTRKLDTAEKVAHNWCDAFVSVERNRDRILVVRYEDLVHEPRTELDKIAGWLEVDPKGFALSAVHSNSVGKYRLSLTQAETEQVDRIVSQRLPASYQGASE